MVSLFVVFDVPGVYCSVFGPYFVKLWVFPVFGVLCLVLILLSCA